MEDSESKSQYLDHLQSFNQGDGKVVLSSDVKNDKGVLLAAKGERLNDKNIDLMIRHKLSKPLDTCIGLEPSLCPSTLKKAFEDIFDEYKDIAKVVQLTGAKQALPGGLHHLVKYPLIYQKLTIMAHVLPHYFKTSLMNSALSLALAIFSEESKPDCLKIFIVSLVENFGLLHLDKRVSEATVPPLDLWPTYHAHPLVSKELLTSIPSFPPSIIKAVAQHHERIDGTGFPAMLKGSDISTFVHYTRIIDELTRLKFSLEKLKNTNIFELLSVLQFRRQHFPSQLFGRLQAMLGQAGITLETEVFKEELRSFARLQLFYYSKCMIYCDIIARIADSTTASNDSNSRSLIRLNTLSKTFIHTVFSSGMLSLAIRRLIEECMDSKIVELLPDMVGIDHAHHGILDQINEIFLFLEYTVKYEKLPNQVKETSAFTSAQACYALLHHIQEMKSQDYGWKSLMDEIYNGRNELSAIIKSMQE